VKLRNKLYDIIKLNADQVLFISVCGSCVAAIEAHGRPTDPPGVIDTVVVQPNRGETVNPADFEKTITALAGNGPFP
jgi:hypothetical protein